MKEIYLGDGLFASFDGWQIKLRAPRDHGNHEVYLDGHMLIELLRGAKTWGLISQQNNWSNEK